MQYDGAPMKFCVCHSHQQLWEVTFVNSLRTSDPYMRQWDKASSVHNGLVWSAPCHYPNQCWWIVNWTIGKKSMRFQRKFEAFNSRKCIRKCRLRNGGQFVSVAMCWMHTKFFLCVPNPCRIFFWKSRFIVISARPVICHTLSNIKWVPACWSSKRFLKY